MPPNFDLDWHLCDEQLETDRERELQVVHSVEPLATAFAGCLPLFPAISLPFRLSPVFDPSRHPVFQQETNTT
jgi:hypothetical protein